MLIDTVKGFKKTLVRFAVSQGLLSILDLVGVAAIGMLGAISIRGMKSMAAGNRVSRILELIRLDSYSLNRQVVILGIFAVTVLIIRTLLSIYITRKSYFFLSMKSSEISTRLFAKYINQSLPRVHAHSYQDVVYSVTSGINALVVGVIGGMLTLVAEFSLLVLMLIALVLVDKLIAVITLCAFGSLAAGLYYFLNSRAHHIGVESSKYAIASDEVIYEALGSYRELFVRHSLGSYVSKLRRYRNIHANYLAEQQFLPSISKYAIEIAVVVGALGISAIQFKLYDSNHAVASLAVFIAAGMRIAPSLMRLQQGLIQIKSSLGVAEPTLNLMQELAEVEPLANSFGPNNREGKDFVSRIDAIAITVQYEGSASPAISDVNIEITPGSFVAIVGPSGSGKTTLVDSLLGLTKPKIGSVSISGVSPEQALEKWSGKVAYVPQNVVIHPGTLRRNITLGFEPSEIPDFKIEDAVRFSYLEDFLEELPLGLETDLGRQGTKLSGGQRQRIGIARALLSDPQILIFDEATSSLDSASEKEISMALRRLRGKVTIISIAHRLSSVQDADLVYYLQNGHVQASGTFEQVRALVPDFDAQAKLLGL
jgi:ATP-binding cassette subfamily C protein